MLRAQGLRAAEFEGEPVGLLDAWEGAGLAIVIDAVSSGAPAGTVHRLDASAQPLPASLAGAPSTHAVGLGQAIELARTLGRLPARLVVYGIEGERFSASEELSPSVAEALNGLVEQVRDEVVQMEEG
jgi:hydrogenase maturation protease